MKTDFKVYPRKIHIYRGANGCWQYVCSTNASKTCRDAVSRYKEENKIPQDANIVRAWFAKD
jgi:hypothetical protein